MNEEQENVPTEGPEEGLPPAERPAAGQTFNIGGIDGQIVNAGGHMTLSGGVTLNAAFDNARQNIQSRLDHARDAAEQMPHGDDAQRENLVQLVESLRAELKNVSAQQEEDVLKLSKRLDALMSEMQDEQPDPEMVTITGEGLKKAAENLAGVLPIVARIAVQIVSEVGVLVR